MFATPTMHHCCHFRLPQVAPILPAERIAYAEYKVWDKNTRDLHGRTQRFIKHHCALYSLPRNGHIIPESSVSGNTYCNEVSYDRILLSKVYEIRYKFSKNF